MTQEQKELLLKDLCARLPYGVICGIYNTHCTIKERLVFSGITRFIDDTICVKPYLFPLSSMTEEQKYDFYCRFIENDCDFDDFKEFYFENNEWHKMLTLIDDIGEIIDWFNKNHFDYRGLIEKGLAIDATGLNIY